MRAWLHRFARYRALDDRRRATVLSALFLLPFIALGLRLFGLRTLRQWMAPSRPVRRDGHASPEEIRAIAEAVAIGARHSFAGSTCLPQSLLLAFLLRRRGVASDLHIGVRVVGGALQAHAWIECGGVPLNERPDIAREFAPLRQAVPLAAFRA